VAKSRYTSKNTMSCNMINWAKRGGIRSSLFEKYLSYLDKCLQGRHIPVLLDKSSVHRTNLVLPKIPVYNFLEKRSF
jgi:hypothetical protein